MSELDSSTWVLAKAERNGRPLLIRFRQFPLGLPQETYPTRISLFWKMSEPDENGLPGDEEFDRLVAFEDRLIAALERDEQSILTAVLSHDGENEFVFYTAGIAKFFERFATVPQENDRYPTSTRQGDDSNWSYFQKVIPENVRPLISGSNSTVSNEKSCDTQ